MGKFKLKIEDEAKKDLKYHQKKGNKSDIKRISRILEELEEHPATGIGRPEELKHSLSGLWSRRINRFDRIIYEIKDQEVLVLIISARGHYK